MRKLEYSTRKHNKCIYCTECRSQYYCKHEKCIYPQERKQVKGYPWQAVFARVAL